MHNNNIYKSICLYFIVQNVETEILMMCNLENIASMDFSL
jgi:hypothetical protein